MDRPCITVQNNPATIDVASLRISPLSPKLAVWSRIATSRGFSPKAVIVIGGKWTDICM